MRGIIFLVALITAQVPADRVTITGYAVNFDNTIVINCIDVTAKTSKGVFIDLCTCDQQTGFFSLAIDAKHFPKGSPREVTLFFRRHRTTVDQLIKPRLDVNKSVSIGNVYIPEE